MSILQRHLHLLCTNSKIGLWCCYGKQNEGTNLKRTPIPFAKNAGNTNHLPIAAGECLYLKRSIASGETIDYPGTVVVSGDVNHGGVILAGGDVIVLGQLRGKVHAGKMGNSNSIIYSTQLQPSHIQIAGAAALGPKDTFPCYAEVARLLEFNIIGVFPAHKEHDKLLTITQRQRPIKTALFTGAYAVVGGAALLLFPKQLFGLFFDLKNVNVWWIQLVAILGIVFGVYYIGTGLGDFYGKNGAYAFYLSTIVGRIFLYFSFCAIVASGAAPPPLILVGAVNLFGALLMLNALQK